MVRDIIATADPKMNKALDHLSEDLASLRTGRATTSLVEGIMAENYGAMQPLKAMATLSTPDAHTISITPWDRTTLPAIEKAIRDTQSLGLSPSNDGNTIRLHVPPMTEERRRDIIKQLGEKVESCHISLRNIRHETLDQVKKLERDKQVTQDDIKFAEAELNKKIDQYRDRIVAIAKVKETEIMTV